jgi:hypothetical protein
MNPDFETDPALPTEDVAELDAWTLEETDYELEGMRLGQAGDH